MYFWKCKRICIYFSNLSRFKYLCTANISIHLFYNTINVIKFLMLKFAKSQTVKKCASILSRSSLWSENSTFYNSKLNISISMSEFPTHLILEFTKHLIWNSEELLRNRMKKFNILQILQYTYSINGHLIKEHENTWNCPCWDWNKIGQLSAMKALSKYLKVLWQAARLQDTWEPYCAREHRLFIKISDVNSCLVWLKVTK